MAPTEGRVARPERRWGWRRGTPELGKAALYESTLHVITNSLK